MRPWQAGLCGHSSRDCERSREREPRLQGETGTQERPEILAGAGAQRQRRVGWVPTGAAASGRVFLGLHQSVCDTDPRETESSP